MLLNWRQFHDIYAKAKKRVTSYELDGVQRRQELVSSCAPESSINDARPRVGYGLSTTESETHITRNSVAFSRQFSRFPHACVCVIMCHAIATTSRTAHITPSFTLKRLLQVFASPSTPKTITGSGPKEAVRTYDRQL
jgi:hypothetical protein